MNAAARLVRHNVLSYSEVWVRLLHGQQMLMMFLVLVTLLSAFGIIYIAYATRVVHAMVAHSLIDYQQLQRETDQLLLEKSTLMRQTRIQYIAEEKLNMVTPAHESIFFVHESE